jgi:hypothetical protein
MKLDSFEIVMILTIIICLGILVMCWKIDVKGYKSVSEQCKQYNGVIVKDVNNKYVCLKNDWRK